MLKTLPLYCFALLLGILGMSGSAAAQMSEEDSILVALKTVDPELLPYFPRWVVSEPNLQLQIYQTFILDGRAKSNLDMNNIVVTCAPVKDLANPQYNILLIECGREKMVASEVDAKMKKLGYKIADPKRPYAFRDIPPASPPTAAMSEAILDFLNTPTNVTHSMSLSAFEQVLKIGKTDFWLHSIIGTEGSGYTFLSSGEAKILLRRPLYPNLDPETRRSIPNLINFHIGMGYRFQDTTNGALDFLPKRNLNAAYGGKGIFGFDLHAPFEPRFGVSFHLEVPMQGLDSLKPVETAYYTTYARTDDRGNSYSVSPLLRTTGYAALFYNWWLDESAPENFFRFDLGVNYTDIQEARMDNSLAFGFLNKRGTAEAPVRLWHPTEFSDWVYAKIEYRSQGAFPFGVSAQYSNQMLLSRIYLPLVGDWLYLDARYGYSMRSQETRRPFDVSTFMISPVLRFNF